MFKIINQLIMTKEEQIKIVEHLNSENLELLKSKGNDYGADNDILINFKTMSQIVKILQLDLTKPEQYAIFMVILKIARLTNLLNSNKSISNEPIDDSFKDGINYFKLAYLNFLESHHDTITFDANQTDSQINLQKDK